MSNKVSFKLVKNNYDKRCYMSNGGFVSDCHIEMRNGEDWKSTNHIGGTIITLHRYAIIPIEKYNLLIDQKKSSLLGWLFNKGGDV